MDFIEKLDQIKFVGPETVQAIAGLNIPLMDCYKPDVCEENSKIFQDRLRAMLFVVVGKLGENLMTGVRWKVGSLEEQDFVNIRQAASKFEGEQGTGSFRSEVENLFTEVYDEPLSQVDSEILDPAIKIELSVDRATEGLILGNEPALDRTSGMVGLRDQEGYARVYRLLHTLYLKHDHLEAEEDVRDIIHELAGEGQIFEYLPFGVGEENLTSGMEESAIRRRYGIPQDDTCLTPEDVKCLIANTMTIWEPKIFNYIYHKVGDKTLAEDFTQVVFMRAYANLNCGKSFSGWLFCMAHNLVTDHYRRKGRRGAVISLDNDPDKDSDYIEPADPRTNTQGAALRNMDKELLHAAIRSLPEQQALVISLRFLEEFSIADTAELMNKTEGAIKALQYRAVGSLRKLLLNDRRFEK